jgi:hypothetical protein
MNYKYVLILVDESFSMSVKGFSSLEKAKSQLMEDFSRKVAETDGTPYKAWANGTTLKGNVTGDNGHHFEIAELAYNALSADLIISKGEFEFHWGIRQII